MDNKSGERSSIQQTDQVSAPEPAQQETEQKQQAAYERVEKALLEARTAYKDALQKYSAFEEFGAFRSHAMIASARFINRVAYSDRMAWILSVMSKLAYIDFEDSLEEVARLEVNLRGGGFSLIKTFSRGGTQAFLAKNDSYAVLAFRGTQPTRPEDVLTDVRVYRQYTREGRIHLGFLEAYEDIAEEVAHSVAEGSWPLFITGHSLGGALATIATIKLEEKIGDLICACYTFGGPRVGNRTLTGRIKTPFYRVVHSTDIVTLVPNIGYVHAGQWDDRFLSYGGNIYRGTAAFLIRGLEMLLATVWPLRWSRWVACHSIDSYRQKLEAYAVKRNPGKPVFQVEIEPASETAAPPPGTTPSA